MEQLFFEADSFRITSASIPVIEELYDFMKENNIEDLFFSLYVTLVVLLKLEQFVLRAMKYDPI